ncbi:MAG TPA: hypothetical protein VGR62_24255 [Candidatus Binatia bacterium]|nr:hypothetical protein [Candidatus Binatia bacterium]
MEQNVVEERPKTVANRFELAASRMAEEWLNAGHMSVSAGDLRIAREFLEQVGITVEETPGVLVRLNYRDGRSQEMTREAAVMLALRRLAGRA